MHDKEGRWVGGGLGEGQRGLKGVTYDPNPNVGGVVGGGVRYTNWVCEQLLPVHASPNTEASCLGHPASTCTVSRFPVSWE